MELSARLMGRIVALDTAPLIYFIEEHPTYAPFLTAFFEANERGEFELVTSTVTLLEVLVLPYRTNRLDLLQAYEDILEHSGNIHLVDVTPVLAKRAASLRAKYNLRTPDALQLAAGIESRAQVFLTNDQDLKSVTEIQVMVLNEEIGSSSV